MSQRKIRRKVTREGVRGWKSEDGAEELSSSPDMRPYLEFYAAEIRGRGEAELDAITALPLEKRYTWRVASALKWAFADYDSETVKLDMATLSDEDRAKISDLLKFRHLQLYLFLRALVGPENARDLMTQAMQDEPTEDVELTK